MRCVHAWSRSWKNFSFFLFFPSFQFECWEEFCRVKVREFQTSTTTLAGNYISAIDLILIIMSNGRV